MREKNVSRRVGFSAVALSVLLVGTFVFAHFYQAALSAQASERIEAAYASWVDDQEFFSDQVEHLQSAFERRTADTWSSLTKDLKSDIQAARAEIENFGTKLNGAGDREALLQRLEHIKQSSKGPQSIHSLGVLANKVAAVMDEARDSHDAYNTRIEEEKRIEQERLRQQQIAATRQQQKTSPPSPASSAGSGDYVGRIRTVLNRHGCSTTGILIDDPRIRHTANADWFNNNVLIKSGIGARLGYVAAHECAHMLQYRAYGGSVSNLQDAMNRIYGGSGFTGLERNADCITVAWGYTSQFYTSSCSGEQRRAAQAIISGQRA